MARERSSGKGRRPQRALPTHVEDDIDVFHRSKDKLSLKTSDSEDDAQPVDSEPDEDAVFDLGVDSEDDSDSAEEEDEDSEEDDEVEEIDSDDEEAQDARIAALARQEKELRAKLALTGRDGSDSESESEDQERPSNLWGRHKRDYYAADEDADEDANQEEEEEAKRLQRETAERLREEDFDIPDMGHESDENDLPEGTLGHAAAQVEQLPRGGELTAEQKAAILREAPELATLLEELKDSLNEVRSRIGPLVREVREGGLATAQGLSYLEAKHLLLLHYCLHLTFYLLLKAEGKPVADHPVITRLVEIRAFMDKIRPLDKRLQYQVDKLLAAATAVQARAQAGDGADADHADEQQGVDDPMQYAPRPDALLPHTTDTTTSSLRQDKALANGSAAAPNGVYRPPMNNPTTMEDDESDDPDKDKGRRARRAGEHSARRAAKSEIIRSLAAEMTGAPDEVRDTGGAEAEAAQARRVRERLAARAAEEEDQMTRVPLSKRERQGLKASRRADLSGGIMLDDIADDLSHLVQSAQANGSLVQAPVSQRYGINAPAGALSAKDRSGDADLPQRAPLSDRRALLDSKLAKRQAADSDSDAAPEVLINPRSNKRRPAPSAEDMGGDESPPEEDPFYVSAAQQAKGRKKQKADKYTAPAPLPPLAEPETEGPRKISKAVEKNRGLTPHRRRDLKNPRVKGRKRFEEASKRRRGQVQDVRKPSGGYGGEATGIKARVSKSTRF